MDTPHTPQPQYPPKRVKALAMVIFSYPIMITPDGPLMATTWTVGPTVEAATAKFLQGRRRKFKPESYTAMVVTGGSLKNVPEIDILPTRTRLPGESVPDSNRIRTTKVKIPKPPMPPTWVSVSSGGHSF